MGETPKDDQWAEAIANNTKVGSEVVNNLVEVTRAEGYNALAREVMRLPDDQGRWALISLVVALVDRGELQRAAPSN